MIQQMLQKKKTKRERLLKKKKAEEIVQKLVEKTLLIPNYNFKIQILKEKYQKKLWISLSLQLNKNKNYFIEISKLIILFINYKIITK